MNDQPDDEIYDAEAFIGVEEGLITDGKVLDDLDAEGSLCCLENPVSFAPLSSAGLSTSPSPYALQCEGRTNCR